MPGYDVLSRGEPVLILGGVATMEFGVAVTIVHGAISWFAAGSGPEAG